MRQGTALGGDLKIAGGGGGVASWGRIPGSGSAGGEGLPGCRATLPVTWQAS